MTEDEKQAILAEGRANAASARYEISEADRLEARQRRREQAAQSRTSLQRVAAECQRAYDDWTTREPIAATSSCDDNSVWDIWLSERLAVERELIWAAVGQAIAEYADEERQSVRNEIESKINRLRIENARERSTDIKAQKTLLADVKEILDKLQRREVGGMELPGSGSRMH
jgi:hypothetical protein